MALPKEAWGNTTGWIMAMFVATGIGVLVMALYYSSAVTPPTAFGQNPDNYRSIILPIDPQPLLEEEMTLPGDGGALYRQAADTYNASIAARRPYDRLLDPDTNRPALRGELPLLETLVEAAAYEQASLFADDPAALINYDRQLPRLDALYQLGQAAIKQAGLLARGSNVDVIRARELYRAALVLGIHLYRERVIYREFELGNRLISQSLGGLTALARREADTETAEQLAEVREHFMVYINSGVRDVWNVISAINSTRRTNDAADVHVGDVVAIALSEEADPMWRTEAILRLGKYRIDATRPADRIGAGRYLEQLADDVNDPRHVLAVDAALSLTEPERMVAR